MIGRDGFRLDLHVHSGHSADAWGSVMHLALAARRRGIHGFALTDHDTVAGHKEIPDAARRTGLLIVPGVEVTTAEGHVLALGVHEAVPAGLALPETVLLVEEQGGVAVAAHPFRFLTGMGPRALRERAEQGHLHAAEARNARDRKLVQGNTERACREIGLAMTGGSDVHMVKEIGTAWTRFQEPLATVDDVLDAVRGGGTVGEGGHTARHRILRHQAALLGRAVGRRLRRG